MTTLAGKVVLITGAARGLGLEYARSLGQAGAHVVAGDITDCTDAAVAAGNDAFAVPSTSPTSRPATPWQSGRWKNSAASTA
jgi:NAD(P)-dependent dehydrogenase (short-subunit alcohol dehydrogenase family)